VSSHYKQDRVGTTNLSLESESRAEEANHERLELRDRPSKTRIDTLRDFQKTCRAIARPILQLGQ
jgi:hypothetical protein